MFGERGVFGERWLRRGCGGGVEEVWGEEGRGRRGREGGVMTAFGQTSFGKNPYLASCFFVTAFGQTAFGQNLCFGHVWSNVGCVTLFCGCCVWYFGACSSCVGEFQTCVWVFNNIRACSTFLPTSSSLPPPDLPPPPLDPLPRGILVVGLHTTARELQTCIRGSWRFTHHLNSTRRPTE